MKTKTLISCLVNAQLICTFFVYAKIRFSHDTAQKSSLRQHYKSVRKQAIKFNTKILDLEGMLILKTTDSHKSSHVKRKKAFGICEIKGTDQLRSGPAPLFFSSTARSAKELL